MRGTLLRVRPYGAELEEKDEEEPEAQGPLWVNASWSGELEL